MKRFLIVIVILFFCVGCATQSQQAKTEGTVTGAGIGAITGGIIGAILGDEEGAMAGAGIGALIGGVGGYAYASQIDRHRQELAGRENDLDARIQFARDVNQETETYNRHIEKELRLVTAKIKKQQLSRQDLANEKEALTQTAEEAREQLFLAQENLQEMKDFQQGRIEQRQQSEELDQEIAKMESNLAQLKKNTSALASLSQRL